MTRGGGPDGPGAGDSVRFGKYELLRRLALGGMAEIFLARSASLAGVTKTCVIKRVLPKLSSDRQFVSMFIDEARITLGLCHPHIVRLYDFGQVDGTYYMAIEHVDGVDLVDVMRLLKRRGLAMDPSACAYVAACMAEALHHAHIQRDNRGLPLGIVHRDVSPQNVFLSWGGEIKLGDFGIAAAKNKLTQTQAGQIKGKFAYMSPEQAVGGVVDARVDIWACGVVLHEMLVGTRLFAADNPVATLGRVCEQTVPRPSEKRPGLQPELDDIVLRALERSLERRYPTAEELAGDLWRLLETHGYGEAHFGAYLRSLDWDSDKVAPPDVTVPARVPREPVPGTLLQPRTQHKDPELAALIEALERDPDVWDLVAIGERHFRLGHPGTALSAFRTAAAVFAHRGLLIQAICAHDSARQLLPATEVEADLKDLWRLHLEDKGALERWLAEKDQDGFWQLLQAVDQQGLGGEETALRLPAPLLGRLSPEDFAHLVMVAKVSRVPVGRVILREGERGTSLFAVGRGRLVVHCRPGNAEARLGGSEESSPEQPPSTWSDGEPGPSRIYLSALGDGDLFGEFSILTGRPRSASVEAITDCVILEIDGDAADGLLRANAAFRGLLLEFYKERIGELLLAKNPVFALLSAEDRRLLLSGSRLHRVQDGALIVVEGQVDDRLYFIKRGEVEVYRDDDGLPVFLNKLREGDFFGEIAALHGAPRTANVRAMGEVELLAIHRDALEAVFEQEGRVKQLFEAAAQWRTADANARLEESRRIFEGV